MYNSTAQKKKEEEEEEKKRQEAEVVGRQQKTQPGANKPTGTTSIPEKKDYNKMADETIRGKYGNGNERKQKLGSDYGKVQNIVNQRLGSSKRHNEETSTTKVTRREEQRQSAPRQNSTSLSTTKQTEKQDTSRKTESRAQSSIPSPSMLPTAAEAKRAQTTDAKRIQDIAMAAGVLPGASDNQSKAFRSTQKQPNGISQLGNIDQYVISKPSDFSGNTTGSREQAENDLYNSLYGNRREQLKQDAANDSNVFRSLLGGAGSGALGTLGDLAGIAEKNLRGEAPSVGGMSPDEIYNKGVEAANKSNIFNYNAADIGGYYDAYKEYVLGRMETGDVTPQEIQNLKNLDQLYTEKVPAKRLKELGADARAINEGFASQNPISNFAGQMAPMVLANMGLNTLGVGSEAMAAADKISNPIGRFAAKQGINLIPDLITDTGSEMARNINEGKSKEEILKDAAQNVALNAAANVAFDYAPKGIKAIADRLNGSNVAKQGTEEAAERIIKESLPEVKPFEALTDPYSNVANDIITPSTVDNMAGNVIPEIGDIGSFTIGGKPKQELIKDNGFLNALRDSEYAKIADMGGSEGALDDAFGNIIRAVDSGDKTAYTDAMAQYRQLANANGVDVNRALNRLDRYVEGNVADIDTELLNSITTNIDTIDAELKKLDTIGVPTTKNGTDWLSNAHQALDEYESAVLNGGDVTSATDNLNRALGNLDNQAKKVEGYDGAFSKWKGGGTARGDLYSNSSRVPGYGKTDWTDDMIDELNNVEDNYHARPANQTIANESVAPATDNIPKMNEAVPADESSIRYGKSRVVTNSAVNANIIDADQLKNDPVIKDIARYEKHSNAETLDNALNRVKTEGEKWKQDFISGKTAISDDTDVDTAMLLMQDLNKKMENGNISDAKKQIYADEKNAILRKLRAEGTSKGQFIQAFAKWNNTADGTMLTATKVQQDDVIKPWISKNEKAAKGNGRIASALANMGNYDKAGKKIAEPMTHNQIKEGVLAEIQKEYGSVEDLFNENDIEFLAQMAEDKSIPVWQITDEIEHKLKTGEWYTLDESIEKPKTLNQKLNNALKSMLEEGNVKTEKPELTLKEIREQVQNTLDKEAADFEGQFTDEDIDYLANLISSGAAKQEITDALNTKMATGSFGISADTQQKVNDLFKQAQMYDPNSKQFVDCQSEAFRLLAEEVAPDASPLEKFDTWRYMAMLGNPKTMLRNYVGNKMFSMVTGVSNNIAALGEAGIDKASKAVGGEGIQRTKSILNPIKDGDLIKASALDAEASRYRQLSGSKYEKMDKDALKKSRSVFKSKVMQLAEKAVDAGISDYSAVKKKYSTSLAGYLKANGYDKSIFGAEDKLKRLKNLSETNILSSSDRNMMEKLTKDIAELDKARDYALKQAEYATFHEDNAFAKWLTEASNKAPGPGKAIIEGVIPFKKTPANILRSGVEYSPLGAIDSIKKTGKLIYENTGKNAGNLADTYVNKKGKEVSKTLASDVIDSWSKTMTGSGLLALGYYLYDKGVLLDSNKETKYQDQLEGLQNYSIKINDKTYTVDWLAPAVMPLLLGAEISKLRSSQGEETSEWYENLDKYLNAANRIADPIVETSMLSGIQDTLETAANAAKYNESLNIPTLLGWNAVTGYATQAIPTLSGQIARAVDNTRRSTYTDKEGVAGVLEKQGRKLMNKIPGVSTLNQPYVDTYGREQNNGPTDNPLFNFAYQSLSPGYLANVNTTDADKLSRELYEKSGEDKILPQWQSSLKIGGKKVSPEEYTAFSKAYGEANYSIRDALAKNEWFNSLDDDQKAEIVGEINSLSKKVGQSAISDNFASASKPYEAYQNGGVEGLLNYYQEQSVKDKAKESGLSTTSNAGKEIIEDIKSGNEEAAQNKIDAAQELSSLGLGKSSVASTYFKAQEVFPEITTQEFADTYKAMDSDGNQNIKQAEVIDYLDSNKITSQEEADKIWKAYGNDWKSVPTLQEDGSWKAQKANKMEENTSEGSVDIHNRPKVPTSELKAAGWEDAGEGYATVYSSTYSNEDGTDARNFTPIVVDNGEYVRTVSPEFLDNYAKDVIEGKSSDYLGLQIGGSYPSINDASKAAEQLHVEQEQEYGPAEETQSIPSAADLPDAQPSGGLNWTLSNGYDLKNTKTYQRAVDAGISDADFNAAWYAADADGNGYMKKAEARNYVNTLPEDQRDLWYHILYKGK